MTRRNRPEGSGGTLKQVEFIAPAITHVNKFYVMSILRGNRGHMVKALWNSIKKKNQARILASVWCGHCRRSVCVIVDSGKGESKFLALRGCCRDDNGPVIRLMEPED